MLPDATRQELLAARASLDNTVTAAIWGLLFCAFTPFTALAIPIGLAVTTVAVTIVLPARAQVFGDLIEAAYDLHRSALYPPAPLAAARQPRSRNTSKDSS